MINDFTKKEAPVLSTLGLGGGNASRLVLSSGPVVLLLLLRLDLFVFHQHILLAHHHLREIARRGLGAVGLREVE